MPRRNDIHKILIIGSGPIIIGQACEFDYSGTQACKVLKEEGYQVVLVNSNPATIMTDPEFADRTYIEPLTPKILEMIIERERPDAILPTMGGQTSLNLAVALAENGVLEKYKVELIGAKLEAIKKAEDRKLFKQSMNKIGLVMPKGGFVGNLIEAEKIMETMDFPVIFRPSFTLGGTGGGIAYNIEEYREAVKLAIAASPIGEVLVEESVLGWKEYELEVMKDLADNVVIICSIENFDPMGVHTGDSITVAPAQTLTDFEYQRLRDMSIQIIREIGVETGGSNIQFAVHPKNGQVVVIEMNPRVSRSSALASKATGFPIAKMAAKLAVGYRLDEISNDITKKTPACFEPTIDYVVVKVPRWDFEKFKNTSDTLGIQMRSVGEVMAIGRNFKEAFQKALRSLEIGKYGLHALDIPGTDSEALNILRARLRQPHWDNIFYIYTAIKRGLPIEEIQELTRIDPWFINQFVQIYQKKAYFRETYPTLKSDQEKAELYREVKSFGFSDRQLADQTNQTESEVRIERLRLGVRPVFKTVDTCAAEFESYTPYHYSTYEQEDELQDSGRKKIAILGGGPNRIGQGIEFDYCCVHSVQALRSMGYETLMINCNPETVSTDYDTADKLFFEPLTFEDVMNILDAEKPLGVIVQFGGQTPLKLSVPLEKAGIQLLGTSSDSIDIAEDRSRFGKLAQELKIRMPEFGTAFSFSEAKTIAQKIGYPVLVRPSYVLGGRAMEIIYDDHMLLSYMETAARVSPEHPVLIDKFLEAAFEFDVDAICDGENVFIAGIMQHIEEAGIHSGDSSCVLPPYMLSPVHADLIRQQTKQLALALKVLGLFNIQFALKDEILYVLEVNPRASRTVPFVSKATGIPLAKIATQVIMGKKLPELHLVDEIHPKHISVKQSVFPFNRFPGVKIFLGPEMRSTGEVMGISNSFGNAFAKAQLSSTGILPLEGAIFISVNDTEKVKVIPIARDFHELGFQIIATEGTAKVLESNGIPATRIFKVNEGRPNVTDAIKNGDIQLVMNTPLGKQSRFDEVAIGTTALAYKVPCITTLAGAAAAVRGIMAAKTSSLSVKSIQEFHFDLHRK